VGGDVVTRTWDTSHSVFITEMRAMVELALEAARDERNAK
jgi:hypothetical protein